MGGQKQRVAIARSLVIEPVLLLLDEPLSNLDAKLRENMRVELKLIQRKLNITTIYVTHDQVEALVMSDRVVVMNKGRIEVIDTPGAVYMKPRTKFIADFIGRSNFLEGTISLMEGTIMTDKGLKLRVPVTDGLNDGDKVIVAIRPEGVSLFDDVTPHCENTFPGRIEFVTYVGSITSYHVQLESGDTIMAEVQSLAGGPGLAIGDVIYAGLKPENLIIMKS